MKSERKISMNYSINSEKLCRLDETGKAIVRAELWAESAEDLPAYNAVSGRILAEGTVAVVLDESKLYVLGFDHEWKEWGAEPAASTLNANAVGSLDRTSLRLDPTDLTTETDDLTAERAIEDGVF